MPFKVTTIQLTTKTTITYPQIGEYANDIKNSLQSKQSWYSQCNEVLRLLCLVMNVIALRWSGSLMEVPVIAMCIVLLYCFQ